MKTIIFPVQLTTSRIRNHTRLIHTLAICVTIHTYILPVHSSPLLIDSMGISISYTVVHTIIWCYNIPSLLKKERSKNSQRAIYNSLTTHHGTEIKQLLPQKRKRVCLLSGFLRRTPLQKKQNSSVTHHQNRSLLVLF